MTKIYNVPIYVEEKIINVEQTTLNNQKIIPQEFVELASYGKSFSTKELGLPKDPCWRYNFAYENGKKWITLDVPQNLMAKLGLEPSKSFSDLVFISPRVLKREPECGGITLHNEKEIILVPPGSKLVREKATQTKLTSEEIKELEEKLEELEIKSADLKKLKNIWRNKFLEEKESNGQEFRDQITRLTQERNDIQRELNNQQIRVGNLRNEINRLNGNLVNTQRERNQIQRELNNLENKLKKVQGKLLFRFFKSKENRKKIKDLNVSILRLGAELTSKNQQINRLQNTIATRNQTIVDLGNQIRQLTAERDNLQGQVNQLTARINALTAERDNRPNTTHQEYNNLVQERNNIQNQLTTANALITNTQNRLGINNLNNLPPLPHGETLTSLLARPTLASLNEKQKEVGHWKSEFQKQKDQADNLQTELNKEKGWWDKWIENSDLKRKTFNAGPCSWTHWGEGEYLGKNFRQAVALNLRVYYSTIEYDVERSWDRNEEGIKKWKELIRKISEYYKNQ